MDNNEINREHKYLEMVLNLLKKQAAVLSDKINELREDVIKIKKDMYENVTNIIRDFDDVIVLNDANRRLNEKEMSFEEAARQHKHKTELIHSPYYGRFDYKDNDDKDIKTFYIGKYSLFDNKTFEYYVHDWRAPISSLFYEFDKGNVSFETPKGIRNGIIILKRQYKILDAVIEFMYDSDSIAQDEILGKTLSENTSKNLRIIISSIQKEQNTAIRYLKKDNLMIFGPAGSGKTSVGLHRLAYILYHERDKITSKNIAVISRNNVFNSYISTIIPELGEENINQFILRDLTIPYLPDGYRRKDYYEQANYLLTSTNDLRIESIRVKSSYGFLEYIKAFINSIEPLFDDLKYNDDIICDKKTLESKFSIKNFYSLSQLLSSLDYYVDNEYKDYFILNKDKIKQKAYDDNEEFITDGQQESIYQKQFNKSYNEAKMKIIRDNNLNEIYLYRKILEKYVKENDLNKDILNQNDKVFNNRVLFHEDFNAVLCIKMMLGKIDNHNNIKHVLIDEAQDYSPFQLYFIKNLYSDARFTILADTNQAIHPYVSIKNREIFENIFIKNTEQIYLSKSYRSTGEINRLSISLLSDIKDFDYFDRDGEMPKYIKTDDINKSIVKILLNKNEDLTGILVKTVQQAVKLYEELKSKIDVQLINSPSDELTKNIIILPIILAKGLEFDTVIIPSFSDFNNLYEKNIAYLMCTRALHRLYIIGSSLPKVFSNSTDYINIGSVE